MMKQLFYILPFLLISSCTQFDEKLKKAYQNSREVSVSEIDTDLPVINIVVDQIDFDEMYENYGSKIEVDGLFNLYRGGELEIKEKRVELEIKGASSSVAPLKSLGVKFDDRVDNRSRTLINPPKVLPHHDIDHIKAIRLRSSGNEFGHTMIKDISYTALAVNAGMDLDVMYSEQAVVFINDEFYGVMNIRTEANTNGMAKLYNTTKQHVTLAKINAFGDFEYKDGDEGRLKVFYEAVREKDVLYLKANIDISNYIDYTIFECYVGNYDWPYNNIRMYAIDDSQFRFVLYDVDWVNTKFLDRSFLQFVSNPTRKNPKVFVNPLYTQLFNCLYEDDSFKQQFDIRTKEILSSGLLSGGRFGAIVYDYAQNIESVMPIQIQEYEPNTVTEWNLNVEDLVISFKKREAYLKKEFD